jgi:hypothetical protein
METARQEGQMRATAMALQALEMGDVAGFQRAFSGGNTFFPDGVNRTVEPAGPGRWRVTERPEPGEPGRENVAVMTTEQMRRGLLTLMNPMEAQRLFMQQEESRHRMAISGAANARAAEAQGWAREDRTNAAAVQRARVEHQAAEEAVAAALSRGMDENSPEFQALVARQNAAAEAANAARAGLTGAGIAADRQDQRFATANETRYRIAAERARAQAERDNQRMDTNRLTALDGALRRAFENADAPADMRMGTPWAQSVGDTATALMLANPTMAATRAVNIAMRLAPRPDRPAGERVFGFGPAVNLEGRPPAPEGYVWVQGGTTDGNTSAPEGEPLLISRAYFNTLQSLPGGANYRAPAQRTPAAAAPAARTPSRQDVPGEEPPPRRSPFRTPGDTVGAPIPRTAPPGTPPLVEWQALPAPGTLATPDSRPPRGAITGAAPAPAPASAPVPAREDPATRHARLIENIAGMAPGSPGYRAAVRAAAAEMGMSVEAVEARVRAAAGAYVR